MILIIILLVISVIALLLYCNYFNLIINVLISIIKEDRKLVTIKEREELKEELGKKIRQELRQKFKL